MFGSKNSFTEAKIGASASDFTARNNLKILK